MNHSGPCPHPAFGHLLPEGEGLTLARALSPWERVAEGRVRANSLGRSFLSSSARRAVRPLGMTGMAVDGSEQNLRSAAFFGSKRVSHSTVILRVLTFRERAPARP